MNPQNQWISTYSQVRWTFALEEVEDLSSFGRFSPLHIQSWISLDPSGIHLKHVDIDKAHSEQLVSESSAESSTPEPTRTEGSGAHWS